MNQDEIEKMLNVVAQSWQDQDKFEIEAYIAECKHHVTLNMDTTLALSTNDLPEPTRTRLTAWAAQNRHRLALQMGVVVEMILRKELLGG